MKDKIDSGGQLYSAENAFDYSIKAIRKRHGFSQKYVCEILDVTQTYYSLVESGKRKPSIDFMEKLASIYSIPVAVLVWGSLDEKSIREGREVVFRELKPVLDRLIEAIYF